MAKTLMMRPQVAALRACAPQFFTTIPLSSTPAVRKPVTTSVRLLQTVGPRRCLGNYGPKPVGFAVGRRSFCIRATASDPGSIDSPLMQSMEKKVQLFIIINNK